MEYKDFIIRQRAKEKRERQANLRGERTEVVPFTLWLRVARGIESLEEVPKQHRGYLYQDYQSDMISMGFYEWERASYYGISSFYDLFGR